MDFSPYDGFCCPLVYRLPSNSHLDMRVSNFLAWVNSLPFKSELSKRLATNSNVIPLRDQPFIVKIVEDGYAYMFYGAFAPREGNGEIEGFGKIPYFEFITSDYKELKFEGESSVVVFCYNHGKRYILELYVKAPTIQDQSLNKRGAAMNGSMLSGGPDGISETDEMTMTFATPIENVKEDEADKADKAILLGPEVNPKRRGIYMAEEGESIWEREKDTWKWP